MVDFIGGVGTRPDSNGVYEWTDVNIVVVDNKIVDWTTQFGKDFPDVGNDVAIGNGYKVRVSSLSYEHFGNEKVGAGTLTVANGATFDQSAGGFTMSGRLLNNGSTTLNAVTVVTGSIENNLSLTVAGPYDRVWLMLNGVDGAFTLASQPGTPADLYMRGGNITGYTPDTTNGAVALTHFTNNSRISGYGSIGSDFGWVVYNGLPGGYLRVTNTQLGTIDANVAGETLSIHTQLSAINPIRNDGLMTASNGGTLAFSSSSNILQGATGVLRAENGSLVTVYGMTVTGGTLTTSGTGLIKLEGFDPRVADLRISQGSTVDIGRTGFLEGTIENAGTIVAGDFDAAFIVGTKNLTLTGGGTVKLLDNYGWSGIVGEAPGVTLNNTNNTIAGDGRIAGGYLTVLNDGVIRADQDPYGLPDDTDELWIDTVAALVNTGFMEAVNGATLKVLNPVSGVIDNSNGIIQAIGAGSVFSTNTRVEGGVLKGLNGGKVTLGGATLDGRKNAVTLQGTTIFGETKIEGTILNPDTSLLGSGALKIMADDATLSGGGTVRMLGAYDNPVIFGDSAGAVLTNVNNTIAGVGGIVGGNLTLLNDGSIVADKDSYRTDDTDVLALDALAKLVNTGTLEARNGAVLEIKGLTVAMENKGGLVQAVGAGSKVALLSTVDGGTFAGVSGGVIDFYSATLDGRKNAVTLKGSTIFGENSIEGTILNTGAATHRGGSLKIMADDAVLSGGGTLRMSSSYPVIVGDSAGAKLTNVNNTIAGVGGISGGNLTLVNDGSIIADKDSGRPDDEDSLTLDTLAALTNTGTLLARNGAVLKIFNPVSGTIANKDGVIEATGKGSLVNLRSLTVDGGTLKSTAGGAVEMDRVTLDGTKNKVTLAGEGNLYTVTLKGAVANTGDFSLVARNNVIVGSNATLTGGGSIDVTYDRLWSANPSIKGVDGGGGELVNSDHTIHGDGFLTGFTLVNGAKGRIVADRAIIPGKNDNHSLDVVTGFTVTNSGWMGAKKGATLYVGDKVANAGVIVADGGTVDLRAKVSGTGRIEIRSGGTALVDGSVDHKVVFADAGAGTLSLSNRSSVTGFDFTVAGMGVGDRIRLDAGAKEGQKADFTFTDTTGKSAVLTSDVFKGSSGNPVKVTLSGTYSEGQFDLVGGKDGAFGYVRVKTKDGTAKSELLKAASGGERVIGLGGDDVLVGAKGNDVLDGSLGSDTASYAAATGGVTVSLDTKALQSVGGGMGKDRLISVENLIGSNFGDKLTGNAGGNQMIGGSGIDVLKGLGGADRLFGGTGADDLYGGADKVTDKFIFNKGDSGLNTGARDQIFEFRADANAAPGRRSAGSDLIDLSLINGAQKLNFVESLKKTGKGQVDLSTTGTGDSKHALVLVDWNGDGKADMGIEVMNVLKLSADDFIL